MSLVFSWRVIIPALTQLLFQFEWTVTDIYCCWCWDEYESSFLIILESLKSHLHLRPKKKKWNKKFTQRVWRKPLPLSFRPQRILFQNFRIFFFSRIQLLGYSFIYFKELPMKSYTALLYHISTIIWILSFQRSQRFAINFLAMHNWIQSLRKKFHIQ